MLHFQARTIGRSQRLAQCVGWIVVWLLGLALHVPGMVRPRDTEGEVAEQCWFIRPTRNKFPVLVYNRVPKCGSTSMLTLLKQHAASWRRYRCVSAPPHDD